MYYWIAIGVVVLVIVIPSNTELVNVIGEMAGILPFNHNVKGSAEPKE